ncbi:hypothetical protein GH714_021714 [Hevea brasiliensis]|uniref:Major facilitator superfamily (MFS) profile domain-containing protein n=1 Tax=Hevea brasiliensis TaxID=3981 RepID=A0A6A6L7C3_HEVBR|nr:hypothetical protein GH714_021714 [Hevea brasiliensis]
MELAERFAYFGIASNLIAYLTGPIGQSTATAAENVNAWTGTSFLFPVIGAFVADSFLGRYRTIVVGSLICILEACGSPPHHSSEQFKFLDKAQFVPNDSKELEKVCSLSDVEEAKAVLRLVPIWASCLLFGVVDVQFSTLCTKQGATMDRSISPGFDIPPASLQSLMSLSIVSFIAIYDRIIVPIARNVTGEPSGITMLQRIGAGMFFSALSMAIATVVEMKRLEIAREYGLVDEPNVTVPMSIWWLIPQYVAAGVADALTSIGMQEFFYDQVPRELRSVGLSLYISAFGIGSFISSFLISIIGRVTGGEGRDSWFANNLNRAHLDYFYWLLAGLSTVQLIAYLYVAKKYVYKR